MPDHDEAGLQEVEVDQRALVNILSRYPGSFDVLRELIQNADDAEACNIEVHFETREVEKSQLASNFDVSKLNVNKWIIKNDGNAFKEKDWERLGRIADGNDNSTKVGAFGVGFYSVLSKSDRPLVRSHDKSLRFFRGEDGKLCKQSGTCSPDPWTSIELELRDPEPLPALADLTRFLVSSVAFLANIYNISIYLESERLLHIKKEPQEPIDIPTPQHLRPTTPSETLTVESIQRVAQRITIDTTFASSPTPPSSPDDIGDTLVERPRPGRSGEDYLARTFRNADAVLGENTVTHVTHDLYTATTCVNLNSESEMKRCVESSMKSLPDSFKCKVVYFNSEQYTSLASINDSHTHKCLFFGPQGIVPENNRHVSPVHYLAYVDTPLSELNRGRLFIGQSTNQTTGVGLHISAHFLPTMERGSIDLANGQVAAWNEEVLRVGGLLARIIYEEEMHSAKSKGDLATQLGLSTMARFAFGSTSPHSGVSQILQNAFFSCSHESKSQFPVVSDVGISCASDSYFRQSNEGRTFLKRYVVLHKEIEPCQRSQIISQYGIPGFRYGDIVREFECGVTEDAMRSFFIWWDGFQKTTPTSTKLKAAREKFCKEFASQGVLCSNHGDNIALKDIKYFTFFPLPNDLSPPDSIYVDVTHGAPTKEAVECFGWVQLSLLHWLKYACSQAKLLALNVDSGQDSDVGYRILRVLVQFAFVEDPSHPQWVLAARLIKDLECIPTNMGLKSPANSYFEEANICGSLPVAAVEDIFRDVPETFVAVQRGFQHRLVNTDHIRGVLARIGVRLFFDWEDMARRLETVASEESNYRLLRYLAHIQGGTVTIQQNNDLKGRRIFYSRNHGQVSAAELHLPNEDMRKLGLPILVLSRNGITSSQSDVDPLMVELFIQYLGIQRHPALDKIITLAASDELGIRQSALQYLLSNLETHYRAYKPDDFVNVAFIPTKDGPLACPNEVFASPVWEKLGFKQVPEASRRDLSRLGVKDDPSVDTIIEYLKTPERTLPDLDTAAMWFEHLYLHGKLPIRKLREQLSTIPFVPLKSPGSSSQSSPIEYICPKDCFIASANTKKHYRNIFPFVDFGQNGNSFLDSCSAKKSPDAEDIVRKIMEDPRKYLEALRNDIKLYLDDLRMIASGLDSISEDDKQAMKKAPMFPTRDPGNKELLRADQMLIIVWGSRGFGDNVFVAPRDDILEKLYYEMGSVPLGMYVRHDITHSDHKPECNPPFNRAQVIQRVNCFMDRDKTRKTEVSFCDQCTTNDLQVKVCETLSLKKIFEPPSGVLVDTQGNRTKEMRPMGVKAGLEFNDADESYILWMVNDPVDSVDLRNDIAMALCHVLLKTYGPNDILLLASLFSMNDKHLAGYYDGGRKHELQSAPDAKAKPKNKVNVKLPLPSFLGKLVGARKTVIWTPDGRKTASPGEDVLKAIDLWGKLGPDGQPPDFNERSRPHPTSFKTHNSRCRQAHTIMLKEKKNLQDDKTHIRFFLALDAQCQQPPHPALQEFAKLVSDLAQVFGREASKACYIFWKDTDEELMAFNRDQKYIFLNLAHYHRFFYNKKGVEMKEVITEWYLIMAHEIAHNMTLEHDEYHGSLSSELAITYFPNLHEHFSCFTSVQPL